MNKIGEYLPIGLESWNWDMQKSNLLITVDANCVECIKLNLNRFKWQIYWQKNWRCFFFVARPSNNYWIIICCLYGHIEKRIACKLYKLHTVYTACNDRYWKKKLIKLSEKKAAREDEGDGEIAVEKGKNRGMRGSQGSSWRYWRYRGSRTMRIGRRRKEKKWSLKAEV